MKQNVIIVRKMNRRFSRDLTFLRKLKCCNAKQRKKLLSKASTSQIRSLSDCAHNILIKNIPLSSGQFSKLKKHKNIIRQLGTKGISLKNKKKLLVQQKGGFLMSILAPILASLGGTLISSLLPK